MTTDHFMSDLAARGISLHLEGNRLGYRAPAGSLTPDLVQAINIRRKEIIVRLGRKATVRCTYCDPKDWVDEGPVDSRIRTHCGKCGTFIGYRPVGV